MNQQLEYAEERDAAPANSPLAKYEHATSIPMLLLAVLWLGVLTVWATGGAEGPNRHLTQLLLIALWVLFIIDYLVRLLLAVYKRVFLKESWFDLASVIIPMLRPFHLLTYFKTLPYFRRRTPRAFRIRIVIYALTFAAVFVYTAALYELEFEHDAPGATITSFGSALWWAATTVSTVGYGDVYPVTVPGRSLAVLLMMGGIIIVGVTSALAIQVLNERVRQMATKHHGSAEGALPITGHTGTDEHGNQHS